MARVEPRVDDDRASLADAAASRCRARADVVRDALASAHREFTARGTLDEPLVSAALDAFDGRIARAVAHDAPALGGFVDATEAQLLKRNHGAALSNLLAFARATAVARSRLAVDVASSPHGARVHETTGEGGEGGPGAALELMLLFPRAERTRAALLAHYSDELTRCLDGIDGASREGTRLAGVDPRTAVAVGAVFWLSRRLDVRGTDAKPHAPSFDEIERVLTPMVRARAATATAAFSPTRGDTRGGPTCARLAAKLAAAAAAARAQLSCLSSLPERPGDEFIARVYGAPAASVVGEALDDVLDAMTRRAGDDDGGGGGTRSTGERNGGEEDDDEDGEAAHRACVAGARAWATVRAVADGFTRGALPAAVNAALDANAWRPTLAIRESPASRVVLVVEAAFASRRDAYESTLRRFAFPSAAALLEPLRRFDFPTVRRTPTTTTTTPASGTREVWNACAGSLREAAAVVSAIVATPKADEGVVDVVRRVPRGRAGDRAAGVVATCVACLERVARVAESALRGNLNVADAGGNRVPASTTMGFDDAWTVMRAASRARRLARRCEAAVLEGSPAEGNAESDTRSSTGEGGYGEESRIVAAAKTAAALATRLDRVAGAAEARAIRALLRPATMTLEGAAAQPWRWHRKPERMPNEPPWSPHVDAWARSVDAAAARLAGAKSRDASGARMIAALATLAAAEAAGVYLRTTPSRAWRERFAWDCRRIATAVRDADSYIVDASSGSRGRYLGESDLNSLGRSRRVAIAKALVTRAALLRADVREVIELLPELAAHVGLGMAKVAAGRGADDVASIARGHPWGPGPSPEELWCEEEPWEPWEVDGEDGRDGDDGDGDGDRDETSGGPGDPWRWLPRAEALELDASWRAAEDALARTAPIASVHAALWRRSELADDDRTPLDEAEAAGKEAVRAEIERRGGGVAAAGAGVDDDGLGDWGDGVEFY